MGDAAGATLEFIGRKPTTDEVEQALSMVGGGVFGLAPGQITDDGELTLAMARALADHEDCDIEHVARNYARWAASSPFDIGFPTASSIGAGTHLLHEGDASTGIHLAMRDATRESCMGSKANGSLMRATPLGVWAHRCSADEIAAYARHDSELSHANDSCCDAVACYAIAIASLVRDPGDRGRAWKETSDWATQHAVAEVRQWLVIAEAQEEVPFHPHAGFVKIAFTHAFRHLLADREYVPALRETLAGGGDTDTNACIVGGLIGAACGADAIPNRQRVAVIECDTTTGMRPRPGFLTTRDLPELVRGLLDRGERWATYLNGWPGVP